ncbi:YecA family protein [Marinospirillum alkaliphilum]|uniref:YecA family protein n=1 Tax=Marinospirillum alkaliphilum DSM 21637 TaxID=1122209 RepID=A0A1K1VEK6_9GAMM|nr:YecA family protein [Marinospirillum alkaliphilum]SFX23576.1 uncharacterized protein SAMN02745752_00932 [Marinospirillum alkaliphilum DSM 21637]
MNQDQEPPLILLNSDQLGQLDELLTSIDQDSDEDANLFVALGYITARAIEPSPMNTDTWLPALLATNPEPAITSALLPLLQQAFTTARMGFYQGSGIELPFEADWQADEEGFIADWCAGFLQAAFEQEELWFGADEQTMAELLLPVMALSGLFADEEDFAEMEEDSGLMQQFAGQLQELLLDIYCQLNAPEEKTKPSAPTAGKKKNRRR